MYKLVCGSIFDRKCDILVVPCNSLGGMASGVKNNLRMRHIHNFPEVKEAGDIVFQESQGGFNNAVVIGFAASVDRFTKKCKAEYLHSICEEVKRYSENNFLPLVNIPLLGAGNGGLTDQESFEVLKAEFEKEREITVNIFVQSQKA